MFLLEPAYPGCPGSMAVKRSLLLLLFVGWGFGPYPTGGSYGVSPDPLAVFRGLRCDTIRDAQESRGLGDVYKRQVHGILFI